jgi:propionate catabolism operon transcriptional regulator
VLPWLGGYAWPGNVRELENVLERIAVVYSHHAEAPARVAPDDLRAVLPELFQPAERSDAGADLRAARGAEEAAIIQRVVGECGGNMSEAAKRLGVGRSTLYRKLRGRTSAG